MAEMAQAHTSMQISHNTVEIGSTIPSMAKASFIFPTEIILADGLWIT
jgi:hypothetical protein